MKSDLVSIIIPAYNVERFIEETIESIYKQTYDNFEIVIADDCSKDNSRELIKKLSKKYTKVRLVELKENSGFAAKPRNEAMKVAKGRFICFLDADDKWASTKLEDQIKFMKENNCAFSYTSYEFADANCIPNGKIVHAKDTLTYKESLKNQIIWTSTVMFDMTKITKELIQMPMFRGVEDTATWWTVLKNGYKAYGLDKVLSYYRRTPESISANKFKMLKNTWIMYRKHEKFNVFKAGYYLFLKTFRALLRRI